MASLASLVQDLQTALKPEQVELPGSEAYAQAVKRWSQMIEKPAGVVIFPLSSQDVSIAVQLAVKHEVGFTTVCGGHGTSGDSSISGGMLINMRRMNSVKVDKEKLTLTCAGGCIWRDIDEVSTAAGISAVGGTVQETGVAGFTTGGGFGFKSGTNGLAIDNLLSAEIVLADGRIVQCSETQEPDLFWAIRGAGHLFGVLTEFVFQGFDQPNPVYGGMVMFLPTPESIEHLINFANNMLEKSDGRTAMMCGFATPGFLKKRVIFGVCYHDGPEAEALEIFGPLINNPNIPVFKGGLRPMTMLEVNAILAMAAANEGRRISRGAVYEMPLPPSAFSKVLDMYEELVAEIPEVGEMGTCLFEFYRMDKIAAVSPTATAFASRTMHSNGLIIPRWRSAEYDARCRKFAGDAMDTVSKCKGELINNTTNYINYDGIGAPAARTYGVNYPRLAALKVKYDPTNVFSKRFGLSGAATPDLTNSGGLSPTSAASSVTSTNPPTPTRTSVELTDHKTDGKTETVQPEIATAEPQHA